VQESHKTITPEPENILDGWNFDFMNAFSTLGNEEVVPNVVPAQELIPAQELVQDQEAVPDHEVVSDQGMLLEDYIQPADPGYGK
jgi:hypothetical protein